MSKRLVYTALMGDYEALADEPLDVGPNTDMICFTDNPDLKSNVWQIEVITPRFPNDAIRSARYLKIMGPVFLQQYSESLWIDNTVKLIQPVDLLFDTFLPDVDFCLPFHSFRTSVAAEFSAVDYAGYDDPSRVYEQLIHYSQTRMDVLEEPPFWTAILLRKHSSEIKQLMERWWEHVLRYSRRDQLSLNYVLKDVDIEVNALNIDNHQSDFHVWPVQTQRNRKKTQASTVLDSFRTIPIARLGAMQIKIDALSRELAQVKNVSQTGKLKNVVQVDEPQLFINLLDTLARKKHINLVQVGVCDGVINDPIYDIVNKYKDRTNVVLIEPQSFLIPIISENYQAHPAHQIVNCAIGAPGELKLYRLKDEFVPQLQRTYLQDSPSYRVPAGFVSSNYEHVLKHIQGKLPAHVSAADAIESFAVDSKSLQDVMADTQWEGVDVLQVDTEGMDDVTLSYCNLDQYKPILINFEHFHLSAERYAILCEYLTALGYKIYQYNTSDTLASLVDLEG